MGCPPTHSPFEQMVLFVQASPSSQAVPVITAVKMQFPVSWLHEGSRHASGDACPAQSASLEQSPVGVDGPSDSCCVSELEEPVSRVGNAAIPEPSDPAGSPESEQPTCMISAISASAASLLMKECP